MAGIITDSPAIIDPKRKSPLSTSQQIQRTRSAQPGIADILQRHETAILDLFTTLQQPPPSLRKFVVTDPTGKMIAWIGTRVLGSAPGVLYRGAWFAELYVGGASPTTAPLFANNSGGVIIGKNGYVSTQDENGVEVAWIGTRVFGGTPYSGGGFSEIYIGPGSDPRTAPFYSDGSSVVIGNNGYVVTQDDTGSEVGWMGTRTESPITVTGATNATPIVVTVTSHVYKTGDRVIISGVAGNLAANGTWKITVPALSPNTFSLDTSIGSGAYTSGGTASRLFNGGWFEELWVGGNSAAAAPLYADDQGGVVIGRRGFVSVRNDQNVQKAWFGVQVDSPKNVTGAVNNGAGLIRLTINGHGYVTGDAVIVAAVGGVPNATGDWAITRITANTFDLIGSTFAGTYTSGGTAYRYYGGGWFQTMSVAGTGFADARLRAMANGDLNITNAVISVTNGTGVTVTIDPNGGGVVVSSSGGTATLLSTSLDLLIAGGNAEALIGTSTAGGNHSYGSWADDAGAVVIAISSLSGIKLYSSGLQMTLDPSGFINVTDSYKVDGTQVVTSQQGAITTPSMAWTSVTATADATYDNTERDMLNGMKTSVNQLNQDVQDLVSALGSALTAMRTHGLIAT